MNENKLKVTVYGQGARGLNKYGFGLDLHSSINVEVIVEINFIIMIYVCKCIFVVLMYNCE